MPIFNAMCRHKLLLKFIVHGKSELHREFSINKMTPSIFFHFIIPKKVHIGAYQTAYTPIVFYLL